MNLDHLTREELIKLSQDLFYWQEKYYREYERKELTAENSFYRLAGTIQAIRMLRGLPLLYEERKIS